MSKNNAKLTSIISFKEKDRWYLKLTYEYEDEIGKHTVVIPKAEVPFAQECVPCIHSRIPYFPNSQFELDHPYMDCNDSMPLYEAVSGLASERGTKTPACFFDIITEYASRERRDKAKAGGGVMVEYIEREALLKKMKNWHEKISLIECVTSMPAADVAPVVHGRWEHNSDFPDRFICYGCGAMFDMWKHEQRLFNYCPNCGAKMDGGKDR